MLALEIFDNYVSWLSANVPLAYENLAPPAAPAELDALDEAVGATIPAEVKAVLAVHNGQKAALTASGSEHGVPCIPTLNFLSTTEIQKRWNFWAEIRNGPDIEALQAGGDVFHGAERLIKPLYTSPGWIPLWADPVREDYIGIDLDPAPAGTVGQIINFGRNEEKHFLCATSFTELIRILLDEVQSGAWQASQIGDDEEADGSYENTEILPWFGDPDEQLFNALYSRFETAQM
ncbi:SMI1/KNR4 family protein [Nocardia sp. NPDC051052]|uniref:SMI1/KNR4 family protein n=1 Tax=Nocardia sp. NPDC051052 TaxID=3364322 RepID=UPI0037B6756E